MGVASSLPASNDLRVVDPFRDPEQSLRLHQVERGSAGDVQSLGDDALGDVPDDVGLDHCSKDAVPVQLLNGEVEVVHVSGEGVLLVQGEESIPMMPSIAAPKPALGARCVGPVACPIVGRAL